MRSYDCILLIIIASLAGFFILSIAGGFIFFYASVLKKAPPLSTEERAACRAIVKRGKGYPFICALFVKNGVCACRPCPKLEKERNTRKENQ